MKIDINVDMGESFGRYVLGEDEALMPYVTSANIATCFHAGDPLVLERTIKWAKKYGVAIGAHIGLPDRQGFGRRQMDISVEELRSDMLYQLGAMDAFLKLQGLKMQHVKPHGILYRMVGEQEKYIDTFLDTIEEYNKDLYIMLHTGCEALKRAEKRGLKTAPEVLIDLGYDKNGNWMLERVKKARSPEEVADRAVKVAKEGKIDTIDGKLIDVNGCTVCIHGDSPNATMVATAVRESLENSGVTVTNLNGYFGQT
ncbi:5-oxoprolinase subunit PxpA [Clostridium coskatii]|uniref:LamB/YcsF family protein n=1 Tax=Clostridium coskatii TaxID=1705578 RepID=A0A166UMH0_9CLOT|nr:5-oxoprolinase subunit PxpA [Clostridium coskatii]OAA95058.1 LamB/YcsF family protein [Clostridium coskatii]OBR89777.1 LamB/YcsF family protein [Clostridium coskatii]